MALTEADKQLIVACKIERARLMKIRTELYKNDTRKTRRKIVEINKQIAELSNSTLAEKFECAQWKIEKC